MGFVELVTGISWPVLVGLIVWWLRPEIASFLRSFPERKIALAVAGVTATIEAAAQQKVVGETPVSEKLDSKPGLDPHPNPALQTLEQRLHSELTGVESSKREAVLVRALAACRLEGAHEFNYNRIFGSQIAGMKRLNEVGQATVDDARRFYQSVAEQYPEFYVKYGFDRWLGFLVNQSLINRNANILEISALGRDFLRYLTDQRLSELKAL